MFYHNLTKHERDLLRIVVKNVHMQYFPKEFQSDYEADKLIASLAPYTVERMKQKAKRHKVDEL
jgi:hypothetical protein